ncbi:MAG: hypothetical protein E7503_04565 [Ruminococcus sp.]|nr:hypothetical protein [Ruminococcus sp.]
MNRMKPISILLAAALLCGCAGCGGGNNNTEPQTTTTTTTTVDTVAKSKKHMQGAYDSLCSAAEKLTTIGDAVQGAWHFGIYEDEQTVINLFLATGVPPTSLEAAGASDFMLTLGFSYCVNYTIAAMQNDGYYKEAKDAIDDAKAEIQKVTDDLDYLPDMKNFYSSCLAYYEWLQAPDGNFNQATDTINDYEKELQEFKNDMAFDYG